MPLQPFSGKVSTEVAEQFKAAMNESEAMTFNAFMELLLEAYLNPKTKTVEVPRPTTDQLQEIQLKDNEIGRLKQAIQTGEQQINELQTLNAQLETQNAILEQSQNQPVGEPVEPIEGQITINIPPIMSIVLDIEHEFAKKKSGKDFSIGDLLLNNFWESIVNGASHPFRIWSSSELTSLAKQIKEVQQV